MSENSRRTSARRIPYIRIWRTALWSNSRAIWASITGSRAREWAGRRRTPINNPTAGTRLRTSTHSSRATRRLPIFLLIRPNKQWWMSMKGLECPSWSRRMTMTTVWCDRRGRSGRTAKTWTSARSKSCPPACTPRTMTTRRKWHRRLQDTT